MNRYAATSTRNILVVKEDAINFRGSSFLGLLDEETGLMYDHPDDSFCKAIGGVTSEEAGLIYLIEETTPQYKVSEVSETLSIGETLNVSPN